MRFMLTIVAVAALFLTDGLKSPTTVAAVNSENIAEPLQVCDDAGCVIVATGRVLRAPRVVAAIAKPAAVRSIVVVRRAPVRCSVGVGVRGRYAVRAVAPPYPRVRMRLRNFGCRLRCRFG